jgi:hypothetical protein
MRTSLSALALAALLGAGAAHAAEGALGRPISGTGVTPNAGIVPPEPIMAVNLAEIYFDGSISGSRQVPIGKQATLGLDAEISFTLATFLKVWDTGPGRWNFSSSITLPYVWEQASATVRIGGVQGTQKDKTSNLFDITFTPITAGYHFSKTEHVAFSFNVWAPTGKYDPSRLANPSLNNWTFIPQVAYTRIWPEEGFTLDAVSGIQFYTRNDATDYKNAPLFTLDVMGMKKFPGGFGLGLVVGTVQQLGDDSGPTADALNGFRGHDWAIGPILTYDTKLADKAPLSFSIRWVPTVDSKNRLKSTSTVMATGTLIF